MTIVVGVGELTADSALEPGAAEVVAAESVAAAVAAAAVLSTGVNEGVVAVHLGQMVTVSVVKKVEYSVITWIDVFPCLVWVVVDGGQLVTVV